MEAQHWLERKAKEKSRYPVFDPAGLKVTAFDGTKVLSRAEALLRESFYKYNIPDIFEFPYKIGTDALRPDFTLLYTYTMTDKIWNHLGNWFHEKPFKRDSYRSESVYRWDEYAKIGFYPGHNLLLSFGLPDAEMDVQALCSQVAVLAACRRRSAYWSSPNSALYAATSLSGQSETGSSFPVKNRSVAGS